VGEPIRALTKLRVPRWKRALDVFFASAAILLLSPLLLLVALIIRLGSKGPVLYRQQRVGAGGRLFEMYKFRTFRVSGDGGAHEQYVRQLIRSSADAPEERPMLKLPSSGSLVPLGRFLRSWGLDELPQLLNILRGDMTLVGPRPEVPYVLPEYRPWHHQRFDEVPGLTGLWQVSGKNRLGFTEMVRLDVKYARAKSPLVDLWIMLKTVPALVSYNRPGSRHAQDQATESQR
jgi:lipopolysaccharide/colanic/teichoic acid biosynthesis glycosyltransferase